MPYKELNPAQRGYQPRDTSEAATPTRARTQTVQAKVIAALKDSGRDMSTEEIADYLDLPYATVQPRTTELSAKGDIFDCGIRARNRSGRLGIVWALPEDL